jgi:hypothetical protein
MCPGQMHLNILDKNLKCCKLKRLQLETANRLERALARMQS